MFPFSYLENIKTKIHSNREVVFEVFRNILGVCTSLDTRILNDFPNKTIPITLLKSSLYFCICAKIERNKRCNDWIGVFNQIK